MKKEIEVGSGEFFKLFCSPDRFQKLEDGWIKDTLLGIDWGPSSDETMTWKEAQKYAAEKGGRSPERMELVSLIDDTKHHPAINSIFKDTKTDDWYWTGTPLAGNVGFAWCVGFFGGSVSSFYKYSGGYVRPVRSSQ